MSITMSRNPRGRDRARELRRAMTPAESILWREVRGRRFVGFKFRRQHPIDPFYADFACVECKLVVEVDGESHLDREGSDEERTRVMEGRGWHVLRFWNTEVYGEREAVLEAIYLACEERMASLAVGPSTPLTPNPSPPRGGRGGPEGWRDSAVNERGGNG